MQKQVLMLTTSALILAGGVIAASAQQNRDVEKTLFKLEDDFTAAVVKRDPKALGKLVAPKWVYSDESGVMQRDGYLPDNRTAAETAAFFRKEVDAMGVAVKAAKIEAN